MDDDSFNLFIRITDVGLRMGLLLAARLFLLVIILSLLTMTTPPLRLADGLEIVTDAGHADRNDSEMDVALGIEERERCAPPLHDSGMIDADHAGRAGRESLDQRRQRDVPRPHHVGQEDGECRLEAEHPDLVTPDPSKPAPLSIPATRMAREMGRVVVANIIMLGYLAAVSDLIPSDALRKSIQASVPQGTEEFNLEAFDTGHAYGLEHGGQRNGSADSA